MTRFSYDPPEQSLSETMLEGLDDGEEAMGEDPTVRAAEWLHSKLLLHGLRHEISAHSEGRGIVLSMPLLTASELADALEVAWRQGHTR